MAKKHEEDDSHIVELRGLIEKVLQTGLDPSVFDKDLDVTYAKNVIDFAVGPEYMNMPSLWAKQAEQAVRLFLDYCPACSDTDFLDDVPVDAAIGTFRSKVALLEHGICPECRKNRIELFEDHPWELVSCLGQRSGKTALTSSVLVPYYLHRFFQFKNPARFYGLMSNSSFEVTFVAVTAGQVKRTLWTAFKEAVAQSPWFTDYIAKLKQMERDKGLEKGTLVKVMDSYIWFGNKHVGCSYQAANSQALRGSTRIIGAIDELAWMNSSKEAVRANAQETYASLSNSLRTVRSASDLAWSRGEYNTLPAMMLNISSPSSQYDKMMSLLKEANSDKRKVAFHLSSWDASPLITRKSLETEEQNDPVKFWRDFGAVPPLADSPFIESEAAIYDMATKELPLINWRVKFVKDKVDESKNRYVTAEMLGGFSDNRQRMRPRVLCIDCGETQNSYVIGVYHLDANTDSDEGSKYTVVCDCIVEAKPEKIHETGEVIPVHFPSMFGLAKRICDPSKGLNIKCVLYDRWQSTGQIQELREMRIKAEKKSPKEADFKLLRGLVYSGNFKMPRWEHKSLKDLDVTSVDQIRQAPYTNMAIQFATVREIGQKVVKPEAGDDDSFRTSVLAAKWMTEHPKDFLSKGNGNDVFGSSGPVMGSVRMSSGGGYYSSSGGTTSLGVVKGKFRRR